MIRIKATLLHFALSIILVTLTISAIVYFWYPLKYIGITHFKNIAVLIISIDLVLGPLLTFVVFNPNKKSLRYDLAIIVAIQLSALGYGAYALYETHPLYVTYSQGGFKLINAKDVQPEDALYPEYNISKLQSAKLAYVEYPNDLKSALSVAVAEKVKGARKIEQRIEYYKPYLDNKEKILENALNSKLILADTELRQKIITIKREGKTFDNLVFFPIRGGTQDAIIVLEKDTAKPLATIKSNPWSFAKKS